MKSNIRPKQLPSHLTARVTQPEAERIKGAATRAGLSVSEWTRRTLVEAVDCPPWARLMLGEFLALRSVVVDLQRDLIQRTPATTDRVKAILETADQRKLALADARLLSLAPQRKDTDQ
jgi:mobilization protein NikA